MGTNKTDLKVIQEDKSAMEIISNCQSVQIPFGYISEQCLDGGIVVFISHGVENNNQAYLERHTVASTVSSMPLSVSNQNNIRPTTKISPTNLKNKRCPQLASSTPQRRTDKMRVAI